MTTRDQAPTRPRRTRALPVWAETIVLLVLALLVSAVVKTFFVQMFFVPSGSMRPLFVDDDRILVQKISYWGGDVQRGDVVVFEDPNGQWLGTEGVPATPLQKGLSEVGLYPTGGHLVKRVIGVGGDRVKCCDAQGRVTVNGIPLNEKSYIIEGRQPLGPALRRPGAEGPAVGDGRQPRQQRGQPLPPGPPRWRHGPGRRRGRQGVGDRLAVRPGPPAARAGHLREPQAARHRPLSATARSGSPSPAR